MTRKIPNTITFHQDGTSVVCTHLKTALDPLVESGGTLYAMFGTNARMLSPGHSGWTPESIADVCWQGHKSLFEVKLHYSMGQLSISGKCPYLHFEGDCALHVWNPDVQAYFCKSDIMCYDWVAIYKAKPGKISARQELAALKRNIRLEKAASKYRLVVQIPESEEDRFQQIPESEEDRFQVQMYESKEARRTNLLMARTRQMARMAGSNINVTSSDDDIYGPHVESKQICPVSELTSDAITHDEPVNIMEDSPTTSLDESTKQNKKRRLSSDTLADHLVLDEIGCRSSEDDECNSSGYYCLCGICNRSICGLQPLGVPCQKKSCRFEDRSLCNHCTTTDQTLVETLLVEIPVVQIPMGMVPASTSTSTLEESSNENNDVELPLVVESSLAEEDTSLTDLQCNETMLQRADTVPYLATSLSNLEPNTVSIANFRYEHENLIHEADPEDVCITREHGWKITRVRGSCVCIEA